MHLPWGKSARDRDAQLRAKCTSITDETMAFVFEGSKPAPQVPHHPDECVFGYIDRYGRRVGCRPALYATLGGEM